MPSVATTNKLQERCRVVGDEDSRVVKLPDAMQ